MSSSYVRVSLAMAIAMAASSAATQNRAPLPHMPSSLELMALPEYCQARLSSDTTFFQLWNQRMGPDKFVHLHHFCHGLNYVNRAQAATDKYMRGYYLGVANNEFSYVVRNWPDGYPLKIEAEQRLKAVGIMKMQP